MDRGDSLGPEQVARSDPTPVRFKGALGLHVGKREALPTGTLPIGIELAANCPLDVIEMDAEGKAVCPYPEECWHCGVCRMDCPVDAVRIVFTPNYL